MPGLFVAEVTLTIDNWEEDEALPFLGIYHVKITSIEKNAGERAKHRGEIIGVEPSSIVENTVEMFKL